MQRHSVSLAIISVSVLTTSPCTVFASGLVPQKRNTHSSISITADGIATTIQDGQVETTGIDESGLHALNGGTVSATNSQIVTHGDQAPGVAAESRGAVDIVRTSVQAYGDHADGLSASGADSLIRSQSSQITTHGTQSAAISARDGATIELNDSDVTTLHSHGAAAIEADASTLVSRGTNVVAVDGQGILATNGANVTFTGGSVTAQKDAVTLGGPHGQPVFATFRDTELQSSQGNGLIIETPGSQATLERVFIKDAGAYAMGLVTKGAGTITRLVDSMVRTSQQNSVGVGVASGTFNMQGGSIQTEGDNSHALHVAGNLGDDTDFARVSVKGATLETSGRASAGVTTIWTKDVLIEASTITTHGEQSHGIHDYNNDGLRSIKNSTIDTYGDAAHGALFQGYTNARFDGVNIHTRGAASDGILVGSGTVNIGGGSHIQTDDGAAIRAYGSTVTQAPPLDLRLRDTAITARSNGGAGILLHAKPILPGLPIGSVNLTAERSALDGDIVAENGLIRIALLDHSRLSGTLQNGGKLVDTLTIDASSTWQMRQSSTLRQLDTSGTISFATPDSEFKTLDVTGDLKGGGRFEMRTDVSAGKGDLLRIAGTVEGSHRVDVTNNGAEPTTQTGALEIVQTEGGDGHFVLANRGQVAEIGTYRYGLSTSDTVGGRNSDWSLVNTGELTTTANAAVNTSAASATQAIWYAEEATLVKRLGELRLGRDNGGVWARGFGELQHLDNQGGRAFKQTVTGFQAGADKALPVAGGRWYIGGMAGYSNTDRLFPGDGKGSANSYHLGGYASWLSDNGWYVDAVLKANRIPQEFKVTTTDGKSVKARTAQNAVGVSVEAGRQIPLAQGWFVEPQVSIATVRVGADKYRTDNGLQVEAGAGNSLQLRTSILAGRRIELANGNVIQPYAKVGWVQEFDGKSTVRTNGVATRTDLSGGRKELALGVAASVGKGHRLYADYGYAGGSKEGKPWSLNVGYRYAW